MYRLPLQMPIQQHFNYFTHTYKINKTIGNRYFIQINYVIKIVYAQNSFCELIVCLFAAFQVYSTLMWLGLVGIVIL